MRLPAVQKIAQADLLHRHSAANPEASLFQSYCGGIRSSREANEIYYIGIIDILQLYNAGKRMETFLKGFTHDK